MDVSFDSAIASFWKDVQSQYKDVIYNDPELIGKSVYVFQTGYPSFRPELMVIGSNPGGGYAGEFSLTNGEMNRYLSDDLWFNRLRTVIPEHYLESCVGTNKYYVNTPQDKGIKNKKLKYLGTYFTRKLVDIIEPRHIICLHGDTFNTLVGNRNFIVPDSRINLKRGIYKNIPVCCIPNLSGKCQRFYKKDLLPIFNHAVYEFMNE